LSLPSVLSCFAFDAASKRIEKTIQSSTQSYKFTRYVWHFWRSVDRRCESV